MKKQLNEGIGHESNEPPERINQTVSIADNENNGKACQQERRETGDFQNTVKVPQKCRMQETLFLDNISYEEAEKRRRQEEEEDIDNNIEGIAASGDLSPRQINKLKESNKKYTTNVVPFSTTTRSRKGQANQSDQ
ncbi:hypothetical protein KY290_017471 [Solanum tuberosum]|uniref:Uncharacterized protein n=1 Tax=Solanum tuberosum TaxID=4113 RepID=A0ABQ7VC80_SOLTU|nr:hypothetical protein KY290_017471 [Solanum tuberosum]